MTSLRHRALRVMCAVTLATSMMPTSAFAETLTGGGALNDASDPTIVEAKAEDSSSKKATEIGEIRYDVEECLDKYDVKDAVLSDDPLDSCIVPFAFDGDDVSAKVRTAYDLICVGIQGHEEKISVASCSITVAELKDAMDLVLCNPELWWLGGSYEYGYYKTSENIDECQAASVNPMYAYTAAEVNEIAPEIERNICEALSWLGPRMTEFEKAQVLHDYLVRTCQYSLDVYKGGESQLAYHRAVSALSGNKITVCQGYALAYKWLLARAGINAIYVASSEMKHGWNLVQVDGSWHHVDVTWDDPVMRNGETNEIYNEGFDNDVRHTYFLKSDDTFQGMSKPHTGWGASLRAPTNYQLADDFVYPVYKAAYQYDCDIDGHKYGEYTYNNDATCTKDGTETRHCVYCRKAESRTATGTKLGHSYGAYVYNNDAKVGVDGTETATCSRCGAQDTRTKVGTAKKDDASNPGTTKPSTPTTKPTSPSTPTTKPSTSTGSPVTTATPAPAVGQTVSSGGATYTVTGAAAVTYARPSSKKAASVTVPATVAISGRTYKVTAIASKAFAGNKYLKSVKIGANVTAVPASAFKGCTKLTSVSFGNGITSIGKNAFYGCKALKSVTLGTKIATIGDGAFQNCAKLTKVTVKSTKLSKVGKSAFAGCKKLKTVSLKTTKLKSVGKNALKGTAKKLVVKVPKSKVRAYQKLFKSKGSKTVVVKK